MQPPAPTPRHAPAPPANAPSKVNRPITPKTVTGPTYTAVAFELDVQEMATGTVHPRIRFLQADGSRLPLNAIPLVAGVDPKQAQALLDAAAATPAEAGETRAAWTARAFSPYVALVYGVTPA